MFTQLTLCSLY